eukprot:scpid56148/ scgid25401/ FAD-dependent oxidoreductase domain-containing protein 1
MLRFRKAGQLASSSLWGRWRCMSGVADASTTTAASHSQPSGSDYTGDLDYDVVLTGGGIMGSSAAYFLSKRIDPRRICVVERDPTYKLASTPLSVGGVRHQFSNRENVLMSMFAMEFIQTMGKELHVEGHDPPDAHFCDDGYLLLASSAGVDTLRENYAVQQECNASVRLMTRTELADKFPWVNLDGIELGCYGFKNEGWVDPWSLLRAFRAKAASSGVRFLTGTVTSVQCDGTAVTGVGVQCGDNGHDGGGEAATTTTTADLKCNYLVNSAGPFAADVAAMAGIGAPERLVHLDQSELDPRLAVPLPVKARRRCVFGVDQRDGPVSHCPLTVDTSGAYIRREGTGGMFLCGKCPDKEDDHNNLDLSVDYAFFEETLWPLIANRAPVFESLKLKNAWAGYYDYNTFDQNGIIGRHPVVSNFLFANGFSGHGLQHGAAVGRAISEIVCDGASHSINLDRLGFERIIAQRPCLEKNVI